MHQSEPSSSCTSGVQGSTAAAGVRSKVCPATGSGEFRLQPDFHWTRSLSERVRGMRDSALGVVWKKRREQKLRGMHTHTHTHTQSRHVLVTTSGGSKGNKRKGEEVRFIYTVPPLPHMPSQRRR